MPKGIIRIVKRGYNGVSEKALQKTFSKKGKRVEKKASILLAEQKDAFSFIRRKKFSHEYSIAVSKALSAIGLDPKKQGDRAIRDRVQRAFQEHARILGNVTIIDPENYSHTAILDEENRASKIRSSLRNAVSIIRQELGQATSREFMKILRKHLKTTKKVKLDL